MQILFHWRVLVEILVFWYVIYIILLFVKGTRSEQLLKGLVILGVIFIMAQQLGLTAISWTLTRLFPISVIALVIIFQPELRRGLAQLGQFGIHQENNIGIVDEIARAMVDLSKEKIGAIVIIERDTGLKSYIETGVQIDGKITSYLLTSVFRPKSPLHDGAVIIQDGRIVAAGCVLPLTQEEKGVPKSLGMRHRAAIGISEETDAIAIIVSEETGAISIALGGKLSHNLDADGLAANLKSVFYSPVRKKVSFKLLSSLSSRVTKKK